MMLIRKIFIPSTILIILTTFFSCEKVVELDLKDAQQMTVVEANLSNNTGENYVLLSKSKPFNENFGQFETISGADVTITDNFGNSFSLTEAFPGIYNHPTLVGIIGRTYVLTININGKIISARSTIKPMVMLDSLSHEKINNPFVNNEVPKYSVFTYFNDTPNYTNYYRIKAFSEETTQKGVLVLSDELINGDKVVFPIFQTDFEEGDTVTVQLLSIDEATFRYFNALVSSQTGEVPGNPETNLEGENVVGYFSAYANSELKIAITPIP